MELAVKIPLRLDGQKSKQYPYAAAAARRKDPRQFSGSQAAWNVQEPSVLVHFTDSTLQRLKQSTFPSDFWLAQHQEG